MSYRDDVDALFHRARALQAEVDRLRAELDASRGQGEPPPPTVDERVDRPRADDLPRKRAVWLPPWRSRERELSAEEVIAELRASRPPPGGAGAPSRDDDEGFGVLVARLSAVEHALVMRLLELLGEDDFGRASVAARAAAFDQLVRELRVRLATPG